MRNLNLSNLKTFKNFIPFLKFNKLFKNTLHANTEIYKNVNIKIDDEIYT